MTTSTAAVSYDDIIDAYKWKTGRDGSAALSDDNGNEFDPSFSRLDDELQSTLLENPTRVWTVTETDGTWAIANGYHYVNVMYYMISETDPKEEHVGGIFEDDDCFDDEEMEDDE